MSTFDDMLDAYADDDQPNSAECKFCGKANLHWEHDGDVWVLLSSSGEVHKCSAKALQRVGDTLFEDLT